MISIWPWSRINELVIEGLRQWQVGQEQKAAASLMSSAREADFDIMKGLREGIARLEGQVLQLGSIERVHLRTIEILGDKAVAARRSRRGWKWLYEQKCADWEFQMQENDRLSDHAAHVFEANKNLAEDSAHWQARLDEALLNWKELHDLETTLKEAQSNDGWERTARENESEIVALMAQVKQSDGNTQRVEAERDALQGLHDDALKWVTEKAKEGRVKEATIERLEAEVKRLRGGG